MSANEINQKKIYNETASVVTKLYYDKKLTEAEMLFLLNFLDFIWLDNKENDLISSIIEWLGLYKNSELDEIIKETLITLDFNNEESIKQMSNLVKELLLNKNVQP
ncbi:MAG: hypothetical protein GX333_00865 [Syntrophomonadaceae bacterium]|nr:hypothetical protein [Syntrophomonadaceae bacterium]